MKTVVTKKTFIESIRKFHDNAIVSNIAWISVVIALIGIIFALNVPAIMNNTGAIYAIMVYSFFAIAFAYAHVILSIVYENKDKMQQASETIKKLTQYYGTDEICGFVESATIKEFVKSEIEKLQKRINTVHEQEYAEVECSDEIRKKILDTTCALHKQKAILRDFERHAYHVAKINKG